MACSPARLPPAPAPGSLVAPVASVARLPGPLACALEGALLGLALIPVLILGGCGGQGSPEGPAASPGQPPAPGATSRPGPPHLVLWLVDTLRADHLSAYGYARPTSPVLEGLARDGVLFEQAHVHSNWTQPSITSLLTGRLPAPPAGAFTETVPEAAVTAGEWLGGQGYATAGFTVSIALSSLFGFDQGFDVYEELDAQLGRRERKRRTGAAFDAEVVVDRALAWLDRERPSGAPFFMLLHTVDPHMPHERHPGGPSWVTDEPSVLDGSVDGLRAALTEGWDLTDADRQRLVDLYDEEIAYNDAQLGRLVEALDQRELLEDTLLVIVSDHGEELWDRNTYGHGHYNLHAELTHVPLVLHWPGSLPSGVSVPGLVRGVDLLPTLLDVMGLPPLAETDGTSLAPLLGRASGTPVAAQAERARAGRLLFVDRASERHDVRAARSDSTLLVVNPHLHRRQFYDLVADPEATVNVIQRRSDDAARAQRFLAGWQRTLEGRAEAEGEGPALELDTEARERLEALGYVGG